MRYKSINAGNFRLIPRGYAVLAASLAALLCCLQSAAQQGFAAQREILRFTQNDTPHQPRGGATSFDSAVQQSGAGSVGNTAQQGIRVPAGTILPAKINHGLSTRKARAGQVITARIMQDVPLPGDGKIPEGAKVIGTIVSVTSWAAGSAASISFRFDQLEIHHRRSAIVTDLRALASLMEVQFALTPEMTPGFGLPYVWATTHQIGGDERYGLGAPVTDSSSNTVGTGVFDGVLVHVRARPGTDCRGPLDAEDRLQALWVFSSDACGVYGIPGVKIAHAGRTAPVGEIVLASASGDVQVRGGSGMLLRVIH